ncbi:MAG: type II secretion system GspH family protein [Candidatus Omnitrophica bacterium]|nr:type II secretion system GspH family protein [Candidatus Omnitrophota bacterium]
MNKKGLTLVEIIVSVLIITLLCAGLLGAFVGGHHFMNRSRHRMQALNFAREALDKLRSNYQYASSEMAAGSHDESEIGGNIVRGEMANFPPIAPDDPLTYSVSAEPASGSYKEVTVSVKWEETSF